MVEALLAGWESIVAMARSGRQLPWAFAAGCAVCAICAFGCHKSAWLWNRQYRVQLVSYLVPGLAGLLGFVAVFFYAGSPYLTHVARLKIAEWRVALLTDREWNDSVYNQARARVYELKDDAGNRLEPGFTNPEARPFPVTKERSRLTAAMTFSQEARRNFLSRNPRLGMILHLDSDLPADRIKSDIDEWFSEGNTTYEAASAVELAAKDMSASLERQSGRLTTLGRIWAVVFFGISQVICLVAVAVHATRGITQRV